jgi:hypothetical protein
MRQTRRVILSMRLDQLRNFPDHVVADAGKEFQSIEERRLDGEFDTFGDYEHAESVPAVRVGIAARAVGQELANLVESELHELAHIPWLHSNCKGPKNLVELGENDPETLRMVSDLRTDQVIGLINNCYGISVEQLDGWKEAARLRQAMNDFKHRDGARHYRDINWDESPFRFPQFQEITEQQAYDAIENVTRFLLALDGAVGGVRKEGQLVDWWPPPTRAGLPAPPGTGRGSPVLSSERRADVFEQTE